MSRTTEAQAAALRGILRAVARDVNGTVRDDRLFVGDYLAAQRMGRTIVVSAVWEPAGRSSKRMVVGSATFFASDATETIVAAISTRLATIARMAEVARAA